MVEHDGRHTGDDVGMTVTPTVADLLEQLRDVDSHGIRFEESYIPWTDHVHGMYDRAALLDELLDADGLQDTTHRGVATEDVEEGRQRHEQSRFRGRWRPRRIWAAGQPTPQHRHTRSLREREGVGSEVSGRSSGPGRR